MFLKINITIIRSRLLNFRLVENVKSFHADIRKVNYRIKILKNQKGVKILYIFLNFYVNFKIFWEAVLLCLVLFSYNSGLAKL